MGPSTVILLVEDDENDVLLILRALRKVGLANRVQVARDGVDALDYLFGASAPAGQDRELPQLVLLDLNLPRINGVEVLDRIRADDRTRELPVAVLVSSPGHPQLQECSRLGVQAYLRKPLDLSELLTQMPQLRLSLSDKPPL